MPRRRGWPETYAKDVLGTILEFRGQVIMEHEIVERRLRADMLFVPRHEPAQHNLGIEHRIERASLAELELWAERVLTAHSLAAVLAG